MSRFLAAWLTSLLVALTTVHLAYVKSAESPSKGWRRPPATEVPRKHRRPEQRTAYRSMDVDGKARCSVVYDPQAGLEIQVKALGISQARMALDNSMYWFWVRPFDSDRYYFCHPEEASSIDAIPPLRPSFIRWMLNRECDLSSSSIRDGDYTVDMEFRDGAISRQRYTRGGEVEAEVLVTEFQKSHGRTLPRRAMVFVRGRDSALNVDMGPVSVGSDALPDTEPPRGMKGERLRPEG